MQTKCFVSIALVLVLLRQGYDCTKDPFANDLELVSGFVKALSLVLRIQYKGLLWLALPCGSFTFMSSSGHCRTALFPYGNCWRPFVLTGNLLCSRVSILMIVAIARSVCYFLENPFRSMVNCWPFVNYLMAKPELGSHRTSWKLSLLLAMCLVFWDQTG